MVKELHNVHNASLKMMEAEQRTPTKWYFGSSFLTVWIGVTDEKFLLFLAGDIVRF